MDQDDVAYKKSVRNMSVVLAAIVVTIFVALAVSPYIFPVPNSFRTSISQDSTYGFALHLQINTTSPRPGGPVLIFGWLNSSSGSTYNLTATDSWGVGPVGLWTMPCNEGWPIGVGVMQGHYTQANVTLGTLYPIPTPAHLCPAEAPPPGYFVFAPHSSKVLVDVNGTPQYWVLQSSYTLSTTQLPAGVYTAILADEWGDVLTTNFVVS